MTSELLKAKLYRAWQWAVRFSQRQFLFLQQHAKRFWQIFCAWSIKKRVTFLAVVLGCLILLIILMNALSAYFQNQALIKAENAPIPVITAQVQNITAPQSIEAVGNMQAILSVPVSFDADGVLNNIAVTGGQQVKKGQLIASLDDRADVAQLQAYLANLALQKSTYQRMESIKSTGAVSQQMLDSQKAEWQQALAQVNQQRVVIEQKKFYAPFAGVVSNFNASSGSYLAQGTSIATLVQEAPLMVQYTLPVADRPIVELGQPVTVTSAAYPAQQFTGVLSYVAPVASDTSGTMTLQATIANPDFLLLPGMFVSVAQMVNPNRQLPMVPDVAIMTDVVGQYVFKVQGSTVRKVYVTVGESIGNQIPINSGLQVGDTVVIAGQQKLNDNSPITQLDNPQLVKQILSDTAPSAGASS